MRSWKGGGGRERKRERWRESADSKKFKKPFYLAQDQTTCKTLNLGDREMCAFGIFADIQLL